MEVFINGREATLSDFLDEDLARAVEISLFTWQRAADTDELSGRSKYGWWGDNFAEERGDVIGSKLWLLMRAKLTDETIVTAKEYAEEALEWLIKDRIASAVDVTAERGALNRLDLSVTITKPDKSQLNLRFQSVWG